MEPETIRRQLYKLTSVESSFGFNTLAIVNGKPKILNLKEFISEFVTFREKTVLRRINFDLEKTKERAHILIGISTAVENIDPIINLIMIFVLACIIGYYVIWGVTSALHSPLMAVTNAISSVIIVGALIAAGPEDFNFSSIMCFFAIILASVNIFGGFVVSHRMLSMFKKKEKKDNK